MAKYSEEKKKLIEKAQDIIMDRMSLAGYAISDDDSLTESEKEELMKETKRQMDRVAKMFGYPEAWFS